MRSEPRLLLPCPLSSSGYYTDITSHISHLFQTTQLCFHLKTLEMKQIKFCHGSSPIRAQMHVPSTSDIPDPPHTTYAHTHSYARAFPALGLPCIHICCQEDRKYECKPERQYGPLSMMRSSHVFTHFGDKEFQR